MFILFRSSSDGLAFAWYLSEACTVWGDKYCSYPEKDLTEELRQMAGKAYLMTHTNQECTGQLSGMVNRWDGRAAWGTITLGLLTGDTPRVDRGRKAKHS